jgi:hypothetical protein
MKSKKDYSKDLDPRYQYLDLEKEVVILDGERLTEERVVQLGEELIAEFYRQKGIVIEKEE